MQSEPPAPTIQRLTSVQNSDFDMVQVAKNRYTSDRYHDFISFEVSKELRDGALGKTYGLKLMDFPEDTDLSDPNPPLRCQQGDSGDDWRGRAGAS